MAGSSDIEWTEATWNPLQAALWSRPAAPTAMRSGWPRACNGRWAMPKKYAGTTRKSGKRNVWTGRINIDSASLTAPLNWCKPQRIFVNSMSDLFQEFVEEKFVRRLWQVMEQAHWHTFQILTKRPGQMLEFLSRPAFPTLPNVWLGTSIENEDYIDRIDILRRVPARVRFISFEPLLGPIHDPDLSGIHWAIVGGEFWPARATDGIRWVETLRDACAEQGVAFSAAATASVCPSRRR